MMAHHDAAWQASRSITERSARASASITLAPGKPLRVRVGRAMVDHRHAPSQGAGRSRDGLRVRARSADQQMRGRGQKLYERAQALIAAIEDDLARGAIRRAIARPPRRGRAAAMRQP